jgi:hypothetical protein
LRGSGQNYRVDELTGQSWDGKPVVKAIAITDVSPVPPTNFARDVVFVALTETSSRVFLVARQVLFQEEPLTAKLIEQLSAKYGGLSAEHHNAGGHVWGSWQYRGTRPETPPSEQCNAMGTSVLGHVENLDVPWIPNLKNRFSPSCGMAIAFAIIPSDQNPTLLARALGIELVNDPLAYADLKKVADARSAAQALQQQHLTTKAAGIVPQL